MYQGAPLVGIEHNAKVEITLQNGSAADSTRFDEFRLSAPPVLEKTASKELITSDASPEVQRQLQNEILQWLERASQSKLTDSSDQSEPKKNSNEILKKEIESGVFGPESKRLYREYVNNCVNKEFAQGLRQTIFQTLKLNENLVAGAPFEMPLDSNGRAISRQELGVKVVADKLDLKVKLDPDKLPNLETMQGHLDALSWKSQQDRQNISRSLDNWAEQLNKKILEAKDKYPSGWALSVRDDKLAWCLSVSNAMELRDNIASRVDFWTYAKKMGYLSGPDAPLGVEIIKDTKGETREIKVPMPDKPYLSSPEAQALLQKYRDWLALPAQDLGKSAELLKIINANPMDAIMQGYSQIPSFEENGKKKAAQGVFSSDNKFMYLAAGSQTQLEPGQTLKDLTLIYHDTKVNKFPDGSVQFVLTKQAMNKEFFLGRDWMASSVGQPKVIESPRLDPNTPVFVSNGSELQALRASEVESWSNGRKASDMFWEVAGSALDLSFIIAGGGELLVLKSGGQALLAAGGAMAATAARRSAIVGLDRAAKVALGSAWALDNSNAKQYSFVQNALSAKMFYIGGDAVKNLALMAKGPSAGAIIFNQGLKETLDKTAFLSKLTKGAELSFRVNEVPMTLGMLPEMRRQLNTLDDPLARFDGKMAGAALGDGHGVEKAKPGDFDLSKTDVQKATIDKIEQYERLIERGLKPDQVLAVQKCFSQLKELLSGKLDSGQKEKLVTEWSASFAITSVPDLVKLEESNNGPLSKAELDELFDSSKRALLSRQRRNPAEEIIGSRSQAIANAHAIALLYASRDANGKIPELIHSFDLDVPTYRITLAKNLALGQKNETYYIPAWQPPRNSQDIVSSDRIIRQIEGLVENPKSHEDSIVFGDLLMRTARITASQYAQVLTKVLDDKNSTKQEKLMALSDANGARVAVLLDGLSIEEASRASEQSSLSADEIRNSYGGSAKDIRDSLLNLVKTESDPDLKAMAAAILYGTKRSQTNREEGLLFLRRASDLFQHCKNSAPGEFAAVLGLDKLLAADLKATEPDGQKAIQSAAFLLETKLYPEHSRKEIAEALVGQVASSNTLTSVLALSLLSKELITQLEPAQQERLALTLIANTSHPPEDDATELVQTASLGRLPALQHLSSETVRTQIDRNLKSILSNHKEYGDFKEYRLEALAVLDQLPTKVNFEAELSALATSSRYPEIRQRAFSILESFQSKILPELCAQRLGRETDPELAARIADRDLLNRMKDLPKEQVDSLWSKYADSLDKAISTAGQYPILANFKHDDESRFLAEEVFLLDYKTFKEEALKNASNSWWLLDRFFGNPDKQERDAVKGTEEQRELHWKQLCDLSLGPDREKALKARYLLYQIATTAAVPLTRVDDLDYIETGRQRIPVSSPRAEWEQKAMMALQETLKPGTPERDFSVHLLRIALSEANPWVSPAIRRELLKSWKDQVGKTISENEYYLVLAANARAERIRFTKDYALQNELAQELAKYPGLKEWTQEDKQPQFFWVNRRN